MDSVIASQKGAALFTLGIAPTLADLRAAWAIIPPGIQKIPEVVDLKDKREEELK